MENFEGIVGYKIRIKFKMSGTKDNHLDVEQKYYNKWINYQVKIFYMARVDI